MISVSAENEKEDDIVILYTNDVHCGITDNIGYDGLALYKREMEASHEHVLLADAGDAIQGGIIPRTAGLGHAGGGLPLHHQPR